MNLKIKRIYFDKEKKLYYIKQAGKKIYIEGKVK